MVTIPTLEYPSYSPVPTADFSTLGDLADTYMKAQAQALKQQQAQQADANAQQVYASSTGQSMPQSAPQSGGWLSSLYNPLGQSQGFPQPQAPQAPAQPVPTPRPASASLPPQVANANALDNYVLNSQARATSAVESGGDYGQIGPTTNDNDHAYGRYQVKGSNVGDWTEKYYGQRLTPQQFLANPQAQDAVYRGQMGAYINKYGVEGAHRAWFAGPGGMNNPNASDGYTTVDQYSRKAMANMPLDLRAGASGGGSSDATDFSSRSRRPEPMTAEQFGRIYANPNTQPLATDYLSRVIAERKGADVGGMLGGANPDYSGAAAAAFRNGNVELGYKLLGLAREEQTRQRTEATGAEVGGLVGGATPDYAGAAAKEFKAGNTQAGIELLKAAETQRTQAKADAASAEFNRLLGGVLVPGGAQPAPAAAAPAPATAAPTVPPAAPANVQVFRPDIPRPGAVPPAPAAPATAPPPQAPAPPATAAISGDTPYDRVTNANMIPVYARAIASPHLPAEQKQVAAEFLKRALDEAKTTDKIRNLQALKDSDPAYANKSLLQIEMELRKQQAAPPAETAQHKKVGEELGTLQDNAIKAGWNAAKVNGTLDIMQRAIQDPNFYSGVGAKSVTAWKRAAAAVGGGDESAAPNEIFDKMSNKLVTETLSGDKGGAGLGAGISNADRDFISATVPNLQNSKAGNIALIQIQRKLAERDKVIAKMTRDYAGAHNGLIDYEFLQQVADYQEAHHLFDDMKLPGEAMRQGGGGGASGDWGVVVKPKAQ
jgi:hypothetical protein